MRDLYISGVAVRLNEGTSNRKDSDGEQSKEPGMEAMVEHVETNIIARVIDRVPLEQSRSSVVWGAAGLLTGACAVGGCVSRHVLTMARWRIWAGAVCTSPSPLDNHVTSLAHTLPCAIRDVLVNIGPMRILGSLCVWLARDATAHLLLQTFPKILPVSLSSLPATTLWPRALCTAAAYAMWYPGTRWMISTALTAQEHAMSGQHGGAGGVGGSGHLSTSTQAGTLGTGSSAATGLASFPFQSPALCAFLYGLASCVLQELIIDSVVCWWSRKKKQSQDADSPDALAGRASSSQQSTLRLVASFSAALVGPWLARTAASVVAMPLDHAAITCFAAASRLSPAPYALVWDGSQTLLSSSPSPAAFGWISSCALPTLHILTFPLTSLFLSPSSISTTTTTTFSTMLPLEGRNILLHSLAMVAGEALAGWLWVWLGRRVLVLFQEVVDEYREQRRE